MIFDIVEVGFGMTLRLFWMKILTQFFFYITLIIL